MTAFVIDAVWTLDTGELVPLVLSLVLADGVAAEEFDVGVTTLDAVSAGGVLDALASDGAGVPALVAEVTLEGKPLPTLRTGAPPAPALLDEGGGRATPMVPARLRIMRWSSPWARASSGSDAARATEARAMQARRDLEGNIVVFRGVSVADCLRAGRERTRESGGRTSRYPFVGGRRRRGKRGEWRPSVDCRESDKVGATLPGRRPSSWRSLAYVCTGTASVEGFERAGKPRRASRAA
jgi:hypothetical protein